MADDTQATPKDRPDGGKPSGTAKPGTGIRGKTGPKPRPIDLSKVTPAKPGGPVKHHGPAADKRREAEERFRERKRAKAQGIPIPESAPVRVARNTSPGYATDLVEAHAMAALALDMPELEIEPARAAKLEQSIMAVLSDRGITLTGEGANMSRLVWSVVTIYGPIIIALVRRFYWPQTAAARAAIAQRAPLQERQPQAPQQQAQAAQPAPPPFQPGPAMTGAPRAVNATGLPENSALLFPDGTTVAGAFIDAGAMRQI